MPRISEFYGIVIEMYFADHPPPHFHARYGGDEATIVIATGDVLARLAPWASPLAGARMARRSPGRARGQLGYTRRHEQPAPIAPLT